MTPPPAGPQSEVVALRRWRRQPSTVLVQLLLVPIFVGQVVDVLVELRSDGLSVGGWVWGVVASVLLMMCVVTLVVEFGWSGTRALSGGVQIRGWRSEFIAWDQIADVRIDRGSGDRTIKITLHDGRYRVLPAPTRGFRKHGDTTMSDAVTFLRDQAGLGPAPPPLP